MSGIVGAVIGECPSRQSMDACGAGSWASPRGATVATEDSQAFVRTDLA